MVGAEPGFTIALAHRATAELVQGATVPGVRLEVAADGSIPSSRIYTLLASAHTWDLGELALSTYFMARDLGTSDVALPIFPSRLAPHAGVWVRAGAGIEGPRDLVGRRVGCNSFGTNYAVWWRGILAHQYDVPIQRITWVESIPEHRPDYHPPRRFPVEALAGGVRSEALLAEGRLDAATTASAATPPMGSQVRRLFADPDAELRAYAAGRGVIPINTVLIIRREVVERHPTLPRRLLEGLEAARQRQPEPPPGSEDALFRRLEQEAGRPLTGFGFRANRPALREMLAYCYEQGITRRLYEPEELFLLTNS